ncbi:hypothetical protein ACFSTI_19785 [Rhizorhabdus histidinilytica]|uniref:XRE family transcriptional regulator n=1 Tax=Rhizorhabdus histidinilytica TaxID=439228 RepID=A0A1T5BUT8_9SPHN|nr:hypothetical protein [Rhizorhabdus histidinilytica]SKB51098.1 hypothetical protein SAMN06295920_103314 [Rhizorhabdus histidinilytica]
MSAIPCPDTVRRTVVRLVRDQGLDLASVSRMIGRNDAYLQQFVKRGTPRRLPEQERLHLAIALNVDERELGARDPWAPPVNRAGLLSESVGS